MILSMLGLIISSYTKSKKFYFMSFFLGNLMNHGSIAANMIFNIYSFYWTQKHCEFFKDFCFHYMIIFSLNVISFMNKNEGLLMIVTISLVHSVIFLQSFLSLVYEASIRKLVIQKMMSIQKNLFDKQEELINNLDINSIILNIYKEKNQYKINIEKINPQLAKKLKIKLCDVKQQQSKVEQKKHEFTLSKGESVKVSRLDFLKNEIYTPYMISNSTILQYEKQHQFTLSIAQILIDSYRLKKGQKQQNYSSNTILYFRVAKKCQLKNNDKDARLLSNSSRSLSSSDCSMIHQLDEIKQQIQDLHMDNDSIYFEFQVKFTDSNKIILFVREITQIVRSQQKLSDKIYQDAIEANYSHEQMTPLNSILANSKIVIKRFEDMIQGKFLAHLNQVQNQETSQLLRSIKHSAKIMWYYNKNQIQKMKIKKNEFQSKISQTKYPEDFIKQVIKPFSPMIKRKEINVHLIRSSDYQESELQADWSNFQLSIFNLVQNAVKYNKYRGDLVFILSLKPKNQKETILEVEIIDSGIGIDKEQQQYLFVPFLELKIKQDMKDVKNNSIGMGLTCSKIIMNQLKGKLTLKESQRGKTVFKIEMPVKKIDKHIEEISVVTEKNHTVVSNYKRPLQTQIVEYVRPYLEEDTRYLDKIAVTLVEIEKEKHSEKSELKQQAQMPIESLNSEEYSGFSSSKRSIKEANSIDEFPLPQKKIQIFIDKNKSSSVVLSNKRLCFNKKKQSKKSKINNDKLQAIQQNTNPLNTAMRNNLFINMHQAARNEMSSSLPTSNSNSMGPNESDQVGPVSHDMILGNSLNSNPIDVMENNTYNEKIEIQNVLSYRPRFQRDHFRGKGNSQINSKKDGSEQELSVSFSRAIKSSASNKNVSAIVNQIYQPKLQTGFRFGFKNKNKDQQILFKSGNLSEINLSENEKSKSVSQSSNSNQLISTPKSIENSSKNFQVSSSVQGLGKSKTHGQESVQIVNGKRINVKAIIDESEQLRIEVIKLKDILGKIKQKRTLFNNQKIAIIKSKNVKIRSKSTIKSKIFRRVNMNPKSKKKLMFEELMNLPSQIQPEMNSNESKGNHIDLDIDGLSSARLSAQIDLVIDQSVLSEEAFPSSNSISVSESRKQSFSNTSSSQKFVFNRCKSSRRNTPNKARLYSFNNFSKKNSVESENQLIEELDENYEESKAVESQREIELEDLRMPKKKKQEQSLLSSSVQSQQVLSGSCIEFSQALQDAEEIFQAHAQLLPGTIAETIKEESEGSEYPHENKNHKMSEERKIEVSSKKKKSYISLEYLSKVLEVSRVSSQKIVCDCQPKILAVDDNDFNLMPLSLLIGQIFKVKIDLAFDGEQAVEMFKETFNKPCGCLNRSYRFIFMDLQMPTMDGYEASEKIISHMKEANDADYSHIVALTSYTSADVRKRVLDIGLKDLVNKPLHVNDLQRMVYLHFYRFSQKELNEQFPQLVPKQINI